LHEGVAGMALPLKSMSDQTSKLAFIEEEFAKQDLAPTLAAQKKGFDEAAAAAKRFQEIVKNVTDVQDHFGAAVANLNGVVAEGAKYYLAHGKSVKDIATMYGVAESEIQAVSDQMKFQDSVTEATTQAFGGLAATIPDLASGQEELQDRFKNLVSSTDEFHDGITVAGDTISTVAIPMF